MCGYHGPTYNEIAVTAAILPFLAYDVGIGAFNFYKWSKSKNLQSFKALGLSAAIACSTGGFIYGIWPKGEIWNDQATIQRASVMLQLGLALVFFYPAIDFIFSKNKTLRSYLLKLPIAILGIWVGILANRSQGIVYWLLSGAVSLWDSWIYQSVLRGSSSIPY
jgi:hypothetical protein